MSDSSASPETVNFTFALPPSSVALGAPGSILVILVKPHAAGGTANPKDAAANRMSVLFLMVSSEIFQRSAIGSPVATHSSNIMNFQRSRQQRRRSTEEKSLFPRNSPGTGRSSPALTRRGVRAGLPRQA